MSRPAPPHEDRDRPGRVAGWWCFDDGEVEDDLVRDMVEVLTSFCARLYGRRSARNRALKVVGCAQRDIGPQAVLASVGGSGDGV